MTATDFQSLITRSVSNTFMQQVLARSAVEQFLPESLDDNTRAKATAFTVLSTIVDMKFAQLLRDGAVYRFVNILVILDKLFTLAESPLKLETCYAVIFGDDTTWSLFENKYFDYYLLYQASLV